MTAWIYVIGPVAGPIKVGRTSDPRRRMEALQGGNHLTLVVHHAAAVPPGVPADLVEAGLHRRLSARHLRGEWFDLQPAEAVALVSGMFAEVCEIALQSVAENDTIAALLASSDQVKLERQRAANTGPFQVTKRKLVPGRLRDLANTSKNSSEWPLCDNGGKPPAMLPARGSP